MIRRAFVLLLCSITLMILAGCAAPPPETEEPAAAVPGEGAVPADGNTGGITEGDLAQQGPGVTGQGSLEALKEGTTPQTGVLADVYFEFDRSELAAEAREVLQRNSDWIKENPGVQIEIEGHADNRGTNEYNLALGSRRAQAVKDYLVTLGVAPERFSTISYGEELPVCGESSEECWQKNRRAHFVVRAQRPSS
ncbi:MAG: peptidoglycan-associated lipoprotein Pal [Deltaproteobacteria bacterium]|nr:peptidoglycan-associated lipoprotein Pal [Deltaproteobacteria bacterium]